MIRYVWISMALMLGGCSVQTVVPTTTEYRLEPHLQSEAVSVSGCRTKSLQVARLQAPDHYLSRTIYFGEGEMKQRAYAYAKWVEPLQDRLGELLQGKIAQSGLFAHVFSYKSLVRSDNLLQMELDELMQYYRDDGTSFVRFSAGMLLLSPKGDRVVATLRIGKETEVEGRGVEAGIRAINRVLEQGLDETAVWLGGVCE